MGPARANRRTCASASRRGFVGQDPFAIERHTDTIRNLGGPWLNHPIPVGSRAGALGRGRQGGAPAALPALGRLHRPDQGLRQLLRGARGRRARRGRACAFVSRATGRSSCASTPGRSRRTSPRSRRCAGRWATRMEIMVDANQAQTPGTPHLTEGPVWSYERALPHLPRAGRPRRHAGWRSRSAATPSTISPACAAASDVPIAGGENNAGLHEFRLLIDRDCYDVIQADAVCSEGLLQLQEGRRPTPRCTTSCSSATTAAAASGIAAHLQLSASLPQLAVRRAAPGAAGDDRRATSRASSRSRSSPDADGYVRLPDKPGLGIELGDRWQRRVDAMPTSTEAGRRNRVATTLPRTGAGPPHARRR